MAGSFQGKFLWVNHDADNLKPSPNRYRVFSHVQNEYHRWRKQDAIDRLKSSARIPRVKQVQHERPRPPPTRRKVRSDDTSESKAEGIQIRSLNEQPLPLARWHGNSDPFSAFSVPVTAHVNHLIAFERDTLHPAVHGRWTLRSTEWDYCSACWSWLLPSLSASVGGCYGFLSVAATILARCVQEHSVYLHLSLVYKHKTVKMVQSQVAQSTQGGLIWHSPAGSRPAWHQQPGEPDLVAVFTLLLCEMFNENYSAASTHLQMLKLIMSSKLPLSNRRSSVSILDQLQPRGPPPVASSMAMRCNLYSRILFQDVQRAASTITRTILPMDNDWWRSIGMMHAVEPTNIPPQPHPPDSRNIIPGTALYDLFSEIRQLSLQLVFALPSPPPQNVLGKDLTAADFFYIWNYGQVLMGRSINHALEAKERGEWRDVYASLAMVYFIRLMSSRDGIVLVPSSDVKFYNAAHGLLSEIRNALVKEEELWSKGSSARDTPMELRLWTLYVGSLSGDEEWFRVELKKLAERMGVQTWEGAEKIFKGFSVHGHSKAAWFSAVGTSCCK